MARLGNAFTVSLTLNLRKRKGSCEENLIMIDFSNSHPSWRKLSLIIQERMHMVICSYDT